MGDEHGGKGEEGRGLVVRVIKEEAGMGPFVYLWPEIICLVFSGGNILSLIVVSIQ